MAAVNIARFNIQITGTDQATPVLNNIGRAAQQLFQGLNQAGIRGFNVQLQRTAQQGRRTSRGLTGLLQQGRGLAQGFRTLGIASSSFAGSLSTIAAAAGPAAAALAIVGTALLGAFAGVREAARFEQTSIAFATLIGDTEEAKRVLDDLVDFAARTPFELPEVETATRQLLAFGSSTLGVTEEVRRLGDLSSAIGEPLAEIANLYGKARVEGRAYTRDIIQFQTRGIPVIQELGRQLGKSEEQIRAMTKAGEINFRDIQRALFALTSEGGQFFGITERQSQSLIGLWSTLKDEFRLLLRDFGSVAVPVLRAVLRLAIDVVSAVRQGLTSLREFFGIEVDFTEGLEDRDLLGGSEDVIAKLAENLEITQDEVRELARLGKLNFEDIEDALEQVKAGGLSLNDGLEELIETADKLNSQFRAPELNFKDTVEELESVRDLLDEGVFDKAFEKAKQDAQDALEAANGLADLRSRADQLNREFDPLQSAKDSIEELNALLANELIDQRIFAQAVQDVNKDFSDRLGIVQQIRDTLNQTTTAPLLRRGSVAEIQARFESDEQVRNLEAIRRQTELQNDLIRNLIVETRQERIVTVDLEAVLKED